MINSILLTLILPNQDKNDIIEEIEEMKLLANTIGYDIQSFAMYSVLVRTVDYDVQGATMYLCMDVLVYCHYACGG